MDDRCRPLYGVYLCAPVASVWRGIAISNGLDDGRFDDSAELPLRRYFGKVATFDVRRTEPDALP